MIDLFRFIMLRPPRIPPLNTVVQLAISENLQIWFGHFLDPGTPAAEVVQRARELLDQDPALTSRASGLNYAAEYGALIAALDAPATTAPAKPLAEVVKQIFGQDPGSVIATPGFGADKRIASDALIVAKLASDGTKVDVAGFNTALRAIAVVEGVAADSASTITRPVFVFPSLPLTRVLPPAAAPPLVSHSAALSQASQLPASDDDPGTPGPLPPLPKGPGSVVVPIGIGDLLVVKQRLKGYEGADVAHIENILRTESFKRDTRRLDRTQTTVTTETDVTTEEERDTQSTDRFALQRETANTVKQDTSLKAGVGVSASYGPMVTVKSNIDAATSTSQEDSVKQSTSYSKDVTTRAASKITQTTKQQQTMLTLSEYEEDLHHGFDNTAGPGNISGVYQWVNKVYEAQVYNYGQRLMFDVMVPEPAAFLISQMRKQANAKPLPVAPPVFTALPQDINDTPGDPNNYQALAAPYGTANLDPPPDPTVVVAKEFVATNMAQGSSDAKDADITIPPDYEAVTVVGHSHVAPWSPGQWRLDVTIGDVVAAISDTDQRALGFEITIQHQQPGTLPVAILSVSLSAYAISIELICNRTDRALQAWKTKVHAAIMQDYQQLLSSYQKALADAIGSQPTITIQGQDPLLNRALEQEELKKTCITLMTGQQYEAFGAVELSAESYPEVLIANTEAQGKYARFLEEAFEWEQIMYFFYPYYWGRKGRWPLHVLATDPDPLFSQFLNAGFARVVFPVRLGFVQAVLHLLETGEVWNGGDLPPVNSPLYVSIITELQEQQGAPGTETAQGEPWEVTLPTTLVKLRSDDKLPSWGWDNSKPPKWVELV